MLSTQHAITAGILSTPSQSWSSPSVPAQPCMTRPASDPCFPTRQTNTPLELVLVVPEARPSASERGLGNPLLALIGIDMAIPFPRRTTKKHDYQTIQDIAANPLDTNELPLARPTSHRATA